MTGIDWEIVLAVLLSGAVIGAVPLMVAALGEAIAERAGLLNLGIEGMMLGGAFFAVHAAAETESLVGGLLAGTGTGLAMGLLFGVLTISFRVDQVVVGLAITLFAGGLTGFLARDLYDGHATAPTSAPDLAIPGLSQIPVVGPALFDQSLLVYLTWALVPICAFLLGKTRFGLNLRAVGEYPFAADAAGVDVDRVRYAAITIAGTMAGFAGAFLCLGDLSFFEPGITVGQGFIALALAMVGGWRPYRIAVGALVFGLLRSLKTGLGIAGVEIQPDFLAMIPYIGILIALVVLAGRTALPAALGMPYARNRGRSARE